MLQQIELSDFRNFKRKKLNFSDKINVIVGPNASGKTNVLEAIYLIATGKSFRARVEEEMIAYDSGLSRIKAKVITDWRPDSQTILHNALSSRPLDLEIILTRGEIEIGENQFEKAPRKKMLVNGVSRRLIDFAGNLKTVLFGPWDMDLVILSPSVRRRFLDMVLAQVDREYRRAILSYEKGLRQRNRLLLKIREEGLSRSQLMFWDRLLIKNGDYISQKREAFINFANLSPGINDQHFVIEYDKSAISEARLEQYAQEEIAAATTLVGPHRDDFCLKSTHDGKSKPALIDRDLARFGSRGEQRMGVLWLKLAEMVYIEKTTGEKPVLILDDIFSELDHDHRRVILKLLGKTKVKGTAGDDFMKKTDLDVGQVIITTADAHYLADFEKLEILTIS